MLYVANIMETQADFRELLALFNAHNVEYIVVGGYALAFHGAPRFTGDIDILVDTAPVNSQHILDALHEFGFGSLELTQNDFEIPDNVIQLGVPPVRVDILTSISGVSWEQAFAHKVEGIYGDVPVYYIGLEEFAANKRATGRIKDLADLEALNKYKNNNSNDDQ
ncbi:MAG: nucleotidyl transferase AbiEii/AbiGii toxin family protein [Gammaproteobacteria bacterium]